MKKLSVIAIVSTLFLSACYFHGGPHGERGGLGMNNGRPQGGPQSGQQMPQQQRANMPQQQPRANMPQQQRTKR
ncbi:hypothetical protein [Lonepinella sp. MS14436]|uniref:hypothetical protein n=1 Tax=Lonepinella sp. MS14436 TaxID=3003619 RepID=UPI0036DC86FF